MEERMIFAGAGGQGLMLLGKLVAQAATNDGLNVTFFPSYGAEVRGGTAHCHVVVSDGEIYSPLVEEATSMVIMNQPSLDRFLELAAPGGLVVLNTSLAAAPGRRDGAIVSVPATDIANELGNIRVANMVMLGALNAARHLIRDKTIIKTFEGYAGKVKPEIVKVNIEAYERGRSLGAK